MMMVFSEMNSDLTKICSKVNNFSKKLFLTYDIALQCLNDESFNKHMRNLQSREYTPTAGPPVSIHPKWFDGPDAEVYRHFFAFKQIFADDDLEITNVIAQIKETRNIRDSGNIRYTVVVVCIATFQIICF